MRHDTAKGKVRHDPDQYAHSYSMIRAFAVRMKIIIIINRTLATNRVPSKDTDQSAWMRRLI